MPIPKQSDGFDEHNQNGRLWSKLQEEEQDIFQPGRFEQLAIAHFPQFGPSVDPDNTPSPDEIAQYLPLFQRLVNLDKVEQNLENGALGKTVAKSAAVVEKQGREEVGKIAVQVCLTYFQQYVCD